MRETTATTPITSTGCRDCTDGFEHCHGTYVTHADGTWECTETGCAGGVLVHRWVVTCIDLGASCCASEPYAASA